MLREKSSSLLIPVLGFICGVCATGPMTAVMLALHRRLPDKEKYPLPPREITEEILPSKKLTSSEYSILAWLVHFGFGGAAGAVYACANVPIIPAIRGPLFGIAVWVTSYFGLLPALGILKSAEKHPARRSALMIVAHLIWGWTLASLLDTFLRDHRNIAKAF